MKIQIVRHGVTDGGSFLDVGAVLEYPEQDATLLVKSGYAVIAETVADDATATDDNTDDTVDEAKALGKLKADKLIALAIEHDIAVADDAKKADVIAAIIESGKAAEILG